MRALLAGLVAAVLLAVAAPAASAHPLGNFSVNHLSQIRIAADRVEVTYVLDQAEIPTFQERGLAPAGVLRRKQAEVRRRLALTVDGRPVALLPDGRPTLMHPQGQGGLATTRVELPLAAAVRTPSRVELHDRTFPGRLGWKAIVARPGRGTAVRSNVPSGDPTGGLRRYPRDVLSSPSDVRSATFAVRPGDGSLAAPDGSSHVATASGARAERGFAELFADAAAGHGVLALLLLVAFGWGALHALSPGHGKAMVAAYLVGTRGKARHAVALGATVTVTHTAGVLALGLVALTLSSWILPEDLYPWLNLVAGLLVVVVGAGVLRSRLRRHRFPDHHHALERHHHDRHGHHHAPHQRITRRGLLAMGASAGLIPCPSALVVLLGAVAQHQIALGLVLIVAFSAGLAATLTALGLAVVFAGRALARAPVPRGLATAIPTASALAIVVVGCVLTLQALPGVA